MPFVRRPVRMQQWLTVAGHSCYSSASSPLGIYFTNIDQCSALADETGWLGVGRSRQRQSQERKNAGVERSPRSQGLTNTDITHTNTPIVAA